MKKITMIKEYMKEEVFKRHPELKLLKKVNVKHGILYDMQYRDFHFGCILEDFQMVKLTFYFFEGLNDYEEAFWRCRYKFKLFTDSDSKAYKFTVTSLGIRDTLSNFPLKIVMNRYIDSLTKFKRDLMHVIMMGKGRNDGQREI